MDKKPIDEAMYEQGYNQAIKDLDDFDWQAFRREAAKDILCAIVSRGYGLGRGQEHTFIAIKYTDELIKQLKQE